VTEEDWKRKNKRSEEEARGRLRDLLSLIILNTIPCVFEALSFY
jgi:hypothetical protein